MQVVFLGCGDEFGVPRVGCECQVCRNVLSSGSRNYRTGPAIAVSYGPSHARRVVLVDVAAEFRLQATRLGLNQFDAVLLTHAHDAHVLGLSPLIHVQREFGQRLEVYAPAEVLDSLRSRFCVFWNEKSYRRVIQPQAIQQGIDLWGLGVVPLRVDHGLGGTAYGYILTYGALRVAYVSDMLRATADVKRELSGLDLLVLGTSHYYEGIELWKRSVMDVTGALELVREVAPAQVIFTHLSHSVDYDEVSARLPAGIRLAYDGLLVEVQK